MGILDFRSEIIRRVNKEMGLHLRMTKPGLRMTKPGPYDKIARKIITGVSLPVNNAVMNNAWGHCLDELQRRLF